MVELPATVADTARLLADQGYIADLELATTVHLALAMRRPLFLEGEPGTGKTEIARARGDVEYRDVKFAYAPDKPSALRGVNLTLLSLIHISEPTRPY